MVRRSWREDSCTEVLIQNTKTGVLIGARRLGTMVRPGENFLSRLENFLSSEESDSGEFLCPGLSCKIKRALRFAGGEMASQVNLSEFDVDTVTVSLVTKTEISWCPVCLAPLETGQAAVVLRCGHNFHNNCVGHWLGEGNLSCPVCRAAVKEKEPPSLYWTL